LWQEDSECSREHVVCEMHELYSLCS
jgi:hypothetical protein